MRDLEIERHWQQLLAGVAGTGRGAGHILTRIGPDGSWDFWLALIQPDGVRALLMGLSESVPLPADELPSSRGFSTRSSISAPPGLTVEALLEVRLENPAFSDIFDVLAEDLVRAAEQHADEPRALSAVLGQLRKWQRFVERVPPEGLSDDQRRGLYGELFFLRERVAPVLGLPSATLAWTGPSGAHQDFQGEGFAIEVKTSGSKEPQTMRIASERQLDDQGLRALFLGHLSLEDKVGAGETLPEMVGDLRQRAAETSCEADLEARLFEAGYHDLHATLYDRYGFVFRREHIYEVRDAFPRIIEADLRPGVGNVAYSIAVADCSEYLLAADDLSRRLGGSWHA